MLGPAEDLRDLLLRGLLEARWVAAKVRLLLGRGLVRALRLADGLRQTRDLARPAVVVSARGDGSLGEIPHLRLLSRRLGWGGGEGSDGGVETVPCFVPPPDVVLTRPRWRIAVLC